MDSNENKRRVSRDWFRINSPFHRQTTQRVLVAVMSHSTGHTTRDDSVTVRVVVHHAHQPPARRKRWRESNTTQTQQAPVVSRRMHPRKDGRRSRHEPTQRQVKDSTKQSSAVRLARVLVRKSCTATAKTGTSDTSASRQRSPNSACFPKQQPRQQVSRQPPEPLGHTA